MNIKAALLHVTPSNAIFQGNVHMIRKCTTIFHHMTESVRAVFITCEVIAHARGSMNSSPKISLLNFVLASSDQD